MLLDAVMSIYFWPLAVQAAVHIKNCIPHRALKPTQTPYEVWTGRKPNISHLQLFGSRVTARVPDSDSQPKLEPRGESGIFMCYPRNAKGYLIWFSKNHSILVRRDVIFHGMPKSIPSPVPIDEDGHLWNGLYSLPWKAAAAGGKPKAYHVPSTNTEHGTNVDTEMTLPMHDGIPQRNGNRG